MKQFLKFEQAKTLVQKLKINSSKEYLKLHKEGKLPNELPARPDEFYYKEKNKENIILQYKKLKKLIKSLGIKSYKEYRQWAKTCKVKGVVYNPSIYYTKYGGEWENWYEFCGRQKLFSYEKAKRVIKRFKVKTHYDYQNIRKLFDGLPSNPEITYKNKGWIDWHNFTGREKKDFINFKEAQKVIKNFKITTIKQYRELIKKNKSLGLPARPDQFYKTSWRNYLNLQSEIDIDYKEAKKIVKRLKIKSSTEYLKFYKQKKLPKGMVYSIERKYKNKGWIDWHNFTGREKINFLKFEEAKRLVNELNIKTQNEFDQARRNGLLPVTIPSAPYRVYGLKKMKMEQK